MAYDEIMKRPGCREMDFTKRPMKGFVFVEPEGTDTDSDLAAIFSGSPSMNHHFLQQIPAFHLQPQQIDSRYRIDGKCQDMVA